MVRKAEFDLQSSLSAELQGFSLDNDVTVSLGFKSTQSQALILQDKQPVGTRLLWKWCNVAESPHRIKMCFILLRCRPTG